MKNIQQNNGDPKSAHSGDQNGCIIVLRPSPMDIAEHDGKKNGRLYQFPDHGDLNAL